MEREVEKYGMEAAWKLRKSKTEPPRQSIRIKDEVTGKLNSSKEAADGFMNAFVQKVKEADGQIDEKFRGNRL